MDRCSKVQKGINCKIFHQTLAPGVVTVSGFLFILLELSYACFKHTCPRGQHIIHPVLCSAYLLISGGGGWGMVRIGMWRASAFSVQLHIPAGGGGAGGIGFFQSWMDNFVRSALWGHRFFWLNYCCPKYLGQCKSTADTCAVYILRNGLAGAKDMPICHFNKYYQTALHRGCTLYTPTNVWGSLFP